MINTLPFPGGTAIISSLFFTISLLRKTIADSHFIFVAQAFVMMHTEHFSINKKK